MCVAPRCWLDLVKVGGLGQSTAHHGARARLQMLLDLEPGSMGRTSTGPANYYGTGRHSRASQQLLSFADHGAAAPRDCTGYLIPLRFVSQRTSHLRTSTGWVRTFALLVSRWASAALPNRVGSSSGCRRPTVLVPLGPRGQGALAFFWSMQVQRP